MSLGGAALVLAAIQVVCAVARIAVGRWSDRTDRRIVPLRHAGLTGAVLVGARRCSPARRSSSSSRCSSLGGAAMSSWNGLAFTAAAEIAGRARAGHGDEPAEHAGLRPRRSSPAPLFGVARRGLVLPLAFLVLVAAPVIGWWVLRPLEGEEERRAEAEAPAARRVRCRRHERNRRHQRRPVGPRGRRRLRHRDRRARQGGRRRSATAASTSRTSSARSRTRRSGACSSTARFDPGLPPAEPHPLSVRSGDPRVDVQSALAMLAPEWGFGQLIDISDEEARDQLARASVMALSFVAQSARGTGQPPVPQKRGRQGHARSPSASSSAGAARPTPTTSRRSTPTGSPPPSTA